LNSSIDTPNPPQQQLQNTRNNLQSQNEGHHRNTRYLNLSKKHTQNKPSLKLFTSHANLQLDFSG
jgi:hypothetical protein